METALCAECRATQVKLLRIINIAVKVPDECEACFIEGAMCFWVRSKIAYRSINCKTA